MLSLTPSELPVRLPRSLGAPAAFVLTSILYSSFAHADAQSCIALHESAGDLRESGKLLSAREALTKCVADVACPEMVRDSCSKEAGDLNESIPSITLGARQGTSDLSNVSVRLDGAERASQLDGRSLEIDPGKHSAVFELPDGRQQTVAFVLAEGEKLRHVVAVFAATERAQPGDAAQPGANAPSRGTPTLAYAFGAVAIAGVGAFTYFALDGKAQQNQLDKCRPSCRQADYDAMRKSYLLGDVSLGVSLAAGAGALYFLWSRDTKHERAETAAVPQMSVVLGKSGAFLAFDGRY